MVYYNNTNTIIQNYYNLHQKSITNCDSLNFPKLLLIVLKCVNFYYKLRQFSKLLQLRQKLLQIMARITNCGIIKYPTVIATATKLVSWSLI